MQADISKGEKKPYKTVDDYIKTFPPDVQGILEKIRQIIRTEAPGAVEKIRYQMPAYRLNGPLVYFAAFKDHIGFFPTPSGIAAFKKELALFKWSKGTIQFPLDKPVPYDLVARIVSFRLKENREKDRKK